MRGEARHGEGRARPRRGEEGQGKGRPGARQGEGKPWANRGEGETRRGGGRGESKYKTSEARRGEAIQDETRRGKTDFYPSFAQEKIRN